MKFFLILFLSIFIIVKPISVLPLCNFKIAAIAIPPRIFAETTVDGSTQPVLLTRFLHNKLGIYLSEFSRCYFALLEPNFVAQNVGLLGLVFWLYFYYKVLTWRIYLLVAVFLAIPVLPFLNIATNSLAYLYKLFAIIGLTLFVKNK